ncbi:MAG TPA: pyrroloquinoline quinone biosynthesis peptide chaperone PqqD [Thermoanaerobaculia bacterium]|nr:pyrroloquinoline quinone biosynthesis peptide chaperone PqqD [Thermoanaerobaculia bacterium]
MIGPESRLRRRDRVLTQRAADEWVLLNLDDGQYFALDEVSGRVWDLCDGSRSVADVVAALAAEYDAPRGTIESDVMDFLQEMADESLVLEEK